MALPRLRISRAKPLTGKQWSEAQKAEEVRARRARHQAAITAAEQLLQRLQQASSLEGLAAAAGLKKTAAFFREDTFLTRQVRVRARVRARARASGLKKIAAFFREYTFLTRQVSARTLPLPLVLPLSLALALALALPLPLPLPRTLKLALSLTLTTLLTRQTLKLADNLRLRVRDVHAVLDDASLVPG